MRGHKKVRTLLDLAGACIAIYLAGFGLEGFLIPNGFLDGGVTGISMLMNGITGLPLSLFIVMINVPFIIAAYGQLHRRAVFRSVVTIILLAIWIYYYKYPVVTHDKLLAAIFGGVFLGGGIGVAMRSGSVLDGTELASIIVKKRTGMSVGTIIFIFNAVLFSLGGFLLGIERAMYSVLTYVVASKSVDFILHGIDEFTAVTIISSKSNRVKEIIMHEFAIGMTVYRGKRGLSRTSQDILFCVVNRFEVPKVMRIVKEIDERAFVVTHVIKNSYGGLIKKRRERF